MKKVVYSIRKVRNSDEKLSGLGFINDEGTLFCKCVSKNGKRYTRAFDDVDKHCFPVFGKENEFKGYSDDSGNLCESQEHISQNVYERLQQLTLVPILVYGERAIFDKKRFDKENNIG